MQWEFGSGGTRRPLVARTWSWKRTLDVLLATLLAAVFLVIPTPDADAYPDSGVCFLVADAGGGAGGNDRLTRVDRATGVETPIGQGTGTNNLEANAFLPGADILYSTNQDAGTGVFGTIDLTTGVFSPIGVHGGGNGAQGPITFQDVDGLTFDPFTFELYGSVRRPAAGQSDLLFRIDPVTGDGIDNAFGPGVDYVEIPIVLGRTDIDEIAIDAYDGQMYAIANNGGSDLLLRIDKTTGASTNVGTVGINDMEGLGFYNDGSLFGSTGSGGGSPNTLFDIDKGTAVASNARPLGVGSDYESNDCLVGDPNSIAGTVFLDRDASSTFGGPDVGTAGVTVELYRDVNTDGLVDGGDVLLDTRTTNGAGFYSFSFASTGAFVLQIDPTDLPPGSIMTTDNVEAADFGPGVGMADANNDYGHVLPAADLRLTKTVDDPTPDYLDQVTFTITITNDGPTAASGVEVSDSLPPGLGYDSSTASQGAYVPGTGVWTVGGLASGASATLDIVVDVNDTGLIANIAQVSASDNADPDSTPGNGVPPEDDQGNATVTVPPSVDLVVVKVVDDPTPEELDVVTYTVTLTNNGPDGATNVELTDALPVGVSYDSHTISTGSFVPATGVWDVGTLADGATETLTITVEVDTGTNTQTLTNTATVTNVDQPDNDPGNETDSADIDVFMAIVIGDRIWHDTDGDGIQDAGEVAGVAGVTIELIDPGTDLAPGGGDDVLVDTDTSDAAGAYSVGGDPGPYYLRFSTVAAGYVISPAGAGGDTALDSDPDPATLETSVFTALADDPDIDLGLTPDASLAGFVYADIDNDGVFDLAETGILGVTIDLAGTDDLGNPVATSTLTGPGGAWSFPNLRPGTYAITETQPAGWLDGTDTIGTQGGVTTPDQFDVTLNPGTTGINNNFGELAPASLAGFVYADTDNDGVFDIAETGIVGVTIDLAGTDDLGNPVATSTLTGPGGAWSFPNLRPGTYTITETQPAGWFDGLDTIGTQGGTTTPDQFDVTLNPGTTGINNNFGELPASSVAGSVYHDLDNDGARDIGEPGIPGVTIDLTGTDDLGNPVTLADVTDINGDYTFTPLRPSNPSGYLLVEIHPAGWLDGIDTAGTAGGDATTVNDQISAIDLPVDIDATDYNFGELAPASLAGFVYADTDNDGVFDLAETGILGVTIDLAGTDDLGNPVATSTLTGPGGAWSFPNLRPGTYTITETQPAGWFDGTDTIGTQGGTTTPDQFDVTLNPGTTGINNNFGEHQPASVGNFVWLDVDDDGIQDPAEGIDGVVVNLYDDGGTLITSTVTAGGGAYQFTNLAPFDDYTIEVGPPSVLSAFTTLPGTDNTDDSDVAPDGTVVVTPAFGDNFDDSDAGIVPAAVDGTVWFDSNEDGVLDGSETPLGGVIVNLYDDAMVLVASTATAADGTYSFLQLLPGDYEIEIVYPGALFSPTGMDSDVNPATGSVSVSVSSGTTSGDSDAGILPAVIGDYVWFDLDADGIQDGTEAPIGSIGLALLDSGGSTVAGTTSAADGSYEFRVVPGDYEVAVSVPAGWALTTLGGTTANDSDFDAAGLTGVFAAPSGSYLDVADAGFLPATVEGLVYEDVDGDGTRDLGEPGIGGVDVTVTDSSGTPVVVTTAPDGSYSVNIEPGATTAQVVAATVPSGLVLTTANDIQAFIAPPGVTTTAEDVGYAAFVDLQGTVWHDANVNGIIDLAETEFAGVSVSLVCPGADGTIGTADDHVFADQITGPGYTFTSVPQQPCRITVDQATLPAGITSATYDLDGVADSTTLVAVVAPGVTGVDFGYTTSGSAAGTVWMDIDGDGTMDVNEPMLESADVTVTWLGPDGLPGGGDDVEHTVTTDASGDYLATNLPPGEYEVAVDMSTLPVGVVETFAAADAFALGVGEDRTGLDFGYMRDIDLAITIVPDVTTVAVGDEVTWTVTVTNNGPSDDIGPIIVTLDIGEDLEYLSTDAPGWTSVVDGSTVTMTYMGVLSVTGSLAFELGTLVGVLGEHLTVGTRVVGDELETFLVNNVAVAAVGFLPATGMTVRRFVQLGLLLMGAGALLILLTRRREHDATS